MVDIVRQQSELPSPCQSIQYTLLSRSDVPFRGAQIAENAVAGEPHLLLLRNWAGELVFGWDFGPGLDFGEDLLVLRLLLGGEFLWWQGLRSWKGVDKGSFDWSWWLFAEGGGDGGGCWLLVLDV